MWFSWKRKAVFKGIDCKQWKVLFCKVFLLLFECSSLVIVYNLRLIRCQGVNIMWDMRYWYDTLQTSVELDSMVSGSSRRKSRPKNLSFQGEEDSLHENEGIGLKDVKQILPTCIILLITLLITVTVIPYAFSSVIKQMQAADRMEEWREQQKAAKEAMAGMTTVGMEEGSGLWGLVVVLNIYIS